MASKEIKFNLRLAIDGKEQLVSAVTTAKNLKGALSGTKVEAEKLSESFREKLNKSLTGINQSFGAINALKETLQGLTTESSAFAKSMAIANTMAGKGGKDFAALKRDRLVERDSTHA